MKIISKMLLLVMFFATFSLMSATTGETWRVLKCGGQVNGTPPNEWTGYENVIQDNGEKELECWGKGYERCVIMQTPSMSTIYANHLNHMMDEADSQIYDDNILSGSYNENFLDLVDNSLYYCTIYWEATFDPLTGEYDISQDIIVTLSE